MCYLYAGMFNINARIRLTIDAFPPDKRKRDLDNLFKAVLDSLQAARVFPDDCQIDELSIKRMADYDGRIVINMEQIA